MEKKSQMLKDLDLSIKLLSIFKSVKDKKEVVHMLLVDFRKKNNKYKSFAKYFKISDFNYVSIRQGL